MDFDMRATDPRHEAVGPRTRLAWKGVAALAALTLACAAPRPALAEEGAATDLPPEGQALVAEVVTPEQDALPGDARTDEAPDDPTEVPSDALANEAGEMSSQDAADAEAGSEPSAQLVADEVAPAAEAEDVPSAEGQSAVMEDGPSGTQVVDEGLARANAVDEGPARATADPNTSVDAQGSAAVDAGTQDAAGGEPVQEAPKPPSTGWWSDPATGDTYYYKNGARQRGWVVTRLGTADNARGAKRRYWLDATYKLARGRVIDPTSASDKLKGSYLAYARPDGSIVTGSYRTGSRIYVADKSGHLATLAKRKKRGWLNSKRYDAKGKTRRYYLYRDADGSYYARVGFAKAGYAHYTTSSGYVRTGVWKSAGRIFVASEKGKLAMLKKASRKRGWLSSSAFGQGSQRYYLYRETEGAYRGMCYATKGYSKDGYAHYTTKRGYVTTKDGVRVKGKWYLASERGKLERATKAQIRMVKQAWETPATGSGLCALWVENVAVRAGLPRVNADACDLYRMYGKSADMKKIKPGTIISVSTHSHTWAGSIWGHVGVYVGDGKVRDSVYGTTRTTKLSWWTKYYGTTVSPKWGWIAGRTL